MIWLRVVTLVLTTLLTSTAVAQEGPLILRVLSYNIHHGEGNDGRLDLPRIARVILSANPDVVALQEVDCRAERTGGVDQAAELARLTGMQFVFGANIPLPGGEYGNAVLSKHPIAAHSNHALPSTGGEKRGVLEVEIRLPEPGESLVVWGTHLDHRPSDVDRFASAEFMNRLAEQVPERPTILLGDLNDVRGRRVLQEFEKQWTHTSETSIPTAPATRPRRQIDFVLVRPAQRWRVIETRALEEPVASDHAPLLVVLERKPSESEQEPPVEASSSGARP